MTDVKFFELPNAFQDNYPVEYVNSAVFYIVGAGISFLIFYVIGKKIFARFKVQQKATEMRKVLREIGYSLLSIGVFSCLASIIYHLMQHGYTKMYTDIHEHSIGYFILTCVLLVVLYDAYFYWTHRLIHWKKIFRYVHRVHHLSTDPTPWAALSFHPYEAVVIGAFQLIIVFVFPIHYWAILATSAFTMLYNFMGHLGYEMFPDSFAGNRFTKWSNTATHHNMHHKLFNCHYGLYFNFWDRLMGTQHPQYDAEFEKVRARAKALKEEQQKESSPRFAKTKKRMKVLKDKANEEYDAGIEKIKTGAKIMTETEEQELTSGT